MTELLAWTTLRARAIQAFKGELPNAQTEQDLLEAFEQEPFAVANLLDKVAEDLATGKARSGFAVWRSRAMAIYARREHIADTGPDRAKAIRLTETWIANAGGHIDTELELLDAVFGPYGRLYPWRDDPQLVDRITRHWQAHRPRFRKMQAEALLRHRSRAQTLARIRAATNAEALGKQEADQHAERITDDAIRRRDPDTYLDDLAATVDLNQQPGDLDE